MILVFWQSSLLYSRKTHIHAPPRSLANNSYRLYHSSPQSPNASPPTPLYPHFLTAPRLLQFLSALLSLILFTIYISRLLTTIVRAQGAVHGIVAAALAYTVIATLVSLHLDVGFFTQKAILIILDLCFVVGFVVVAALTSPLSGVARGRCGAGGRSNGKRNDNNGSSSGGAPTCGLVKGTFALAFVSM